MQNKKLPRLILNLLVLITVIGIALTGWLVGHILRFSIPTLWHPPIEEINPNVEIGDIFESDGRRIVASADEPWVRVYPNGVQVKSLDLGLLCNGNTYYTSLPAKCRSADGRLVWVGSGQREIILIPYGEWE